MTIENVEVIEYPLNYRLDCGTLTVHGEGTYVAGEILLPEYHYLTVNGMATLESTGAMATLSSSIVNNFSFETNNILISGIQSFTIKPSTEYYKPLKQGNNSFVLSTNSASSTETCPFDIWVVNPSISVYCTGTRNNFQTDMAALGAVTNFGPEGKYNKVLSADVKMATTETNTAFIAKLAAKDVDIITNSYVRNLDYSTTVTTGVDTALDFIEGGKRTFIYAVDGSATSTPDSRANGLIYILAKLLGIEMSQILYSHLSDSSSDAVILDVNHPIVKGPFGDLSGKTFFHDGSNNWGVKLADDVSEDIKKKFIPIAEQTDGYARVFTVAGTSFVGVADGGGFGHTTSSTEARQNCSDLMGNIWAWAADMKYAE